MDVDFVVKVRALMNDGWDARSIAHATKKSLNLVNAAIVAVRAKPLSPKKAQTMKARLALTKLDQAYKRAGCAVMPNGKIKLREPA